MQRKIKDPVEGYFKNNIKEFIRFGNRFAEMLNDEDIIGAAAQKDIEKVAKVWRLVMNTLSERSAAGSPDRTAELIGAYRDIGEEDEE